MKKFDVEITETLQRTVSVEAVSQEEAEKIVTEAWNNEDYVLDSTDFVSVDFKTVGEQELSENRKMEILLVQPGMYPQKVTIGTELKDFQDAVGGTIAASYPFDDPVAIVYNDEGKHKPLPCDRPSVNSPNDIAMSAYAKGRMNFEYYMNREYAYSRDKGKCKCCGNAFSPMLQKHCHHVKNKLPLDRINKVPNLVWLCEPCHRMVHNSPIPPELDAKTVGKIMKYREKLKL